MDQVIRQTTMNLGVVKKISPHLNKKSLDMLYHSMIVSQFLSNNSIFVIPLFNSIYYYSLYFVIAQIAVVLI